MKKNLSLYLEQLCEVPIATMPHGVPDQCPKHVLIRNHTTGLQTQAEGRLVSVQAGLREPPAFILCSNDRPSFLREQPMATAW